MRKIVLFSLAAMLLLACVLGGCAQSKSVSVGADGIVSAKDSAADTPLPSPTPTNSPTPTPKPTPEPTPTPIDVPGWFYHYDRDLINQDNVLFTLQTMEYDYDAKTLSVVADYTNTGTYDQLIVFMDVTFGTRSFTLFMEPTAEGDSFVILKAGEQKTITFSYVLLDADLANFDLEHIENVDIEMAKLEASDPSQPDNFTIDSFDVVNVELPPAE